MHDDKNTSVALTSEIVAAYVSGSNQLRAEHLPDLIRSVYAALTNGAVQPAEPQKPAVAVKHSVFPDYIICLEDGKKLKMLKRHLQIRYNLSPAQYCEKWNLRDDYPMVAPNYAKRRSDISRQIGLGKHHRAAPTGGEGVTRG